MTENLVITNVRLVAASASEQRGGLLGWVSCRLNGGLVLDGLALRRTADDRLTLSFPARRDPSGRQHFYVRPVSDAARREIEHEILRQLGYREVPHP